MDETTIDTKIQSIVTALEGEGLGVVYDHIPAKPTFPSVIIAPGPDFIDETDDDAFGERNLHIDVWVLSSTARDTKALQKELYKAIGKTLAKLDEIDGYVYDSVRPPQAAEVNQAKYLNSVVIGHFVI